MGLRRRLELATRKGGPVRLLVHVEQYNVVGILPSQLEPLALLCDAMGIEERAFVDGTLDGVKAASGFTRYGSLTEWMDAAPRTAMAFFDPTGTDIRSVRLSSDTWLVFGPAMGFAGALAEQPRISIPGGVLSSRDAVPIALWEVSRWRAR